MSEQKSGKWAAEVYDFLHLFRRINASIYGLILIELGWVLLLIFIGKLTPTPNNAVVVPAITIPWSNSTIAVSDLLLPGSITVIVFWIFWSGLWLYIWLPLRQLLRRIAILALWTVVYIGILLNLALLVLTYPIERLLVWNWLRKASPKFKEKLSQTASEKKKNEIEVDKLVGNEVGLVAELGINDAEKIKNGHLNAEEKKRIEDKINKKALDEAIVEQTGFSRWFILGLLRKIISDQIIALSSRAYIGLAPLQSFSYEEDVNASKAPAQVFSTAIQRLYWKLGKNKLLKHIRFENLPLHFVPHNVNEAHLLRKLLGLDVLVWGSYLRDDANKVWLNIDNNQIPEEDDDNQKKMPKRIFGYRPDLSHKMIVIDQSSIWDVYVALALTVIQTVQSRTKSWKQKMNWASRDELYFGSVHIDTIVDHLIQDTFLEYEEKSSSGEIYPTPRRLLALLAGEWVGHIINDTDKYASDDMELANSLLPILRKCIAVEPDIPENHYRLGLLFLLKGLVGDCIRAFSIGKKYEPPQFFAQRGVIMASVYVDERSLSKNIGIDRPFALAVTHAARAINLGGDTEKEHMRKVFEKAGYFEFRKAVNKKGFAPTKGDPPAHHALYKLLSKEYNP